MHPLKRIFSGHAAQHGVFSVCTANPLVLRAALERARDQHYVVIVEATANQVNQFGGYTGMQPSDYAAKRIP